MKKRLSLLIVQFLLLFAMSAAASAQPYSTPPVQRVFLQQQLDQMLAPIALYPDSLLSQILMASTYPLEVQQAAGWTRANPGWQGDQAVQAVQSYAWDPSVKSLVAFPHILAVMDSRMDWTVNLGDAFLGQSQQIMDTIQYLRRKAISAGTLRSDDRLRVTNRGQIIVIEPVTVQTVYVPYYNPTYAYGSWWWPNYAPVYWDPWPGYYSPYGYNRGLVWGAGVPIGTGLFFGYFDWGHRHVYVRPHKRWHDWRHRDPKRRYSWNHDPKHRHGTPYRSEIVRQRYAKPTPDRDERGSFRGRKPTASPASTSSITRGRTQPPAKSTSVTDKARPATPAVTGTRQAVPPAAAQPPSHTRTRPTTTRTVKPERRPTVFEGYDKGRDVRSFSERGRSSAGQPTRNGSRSSGHSGARNGANVQSSKPAAREQRPAASTPSRQDGPSRGGRGGRD